MGFWARMGCCDCHGTQKVEINWCSATVGNAQQRQEQSFRTARTQGNTWEKRFTFGSLHAANFIYCLCDDSLFVYQNILRVYVLEKVKTILHFF